MKKVLIVFGLLCWTAVVQAQSQVGVQLFDMFKTEQVYLMSPEEFRELQADLREEKSVFKKAYSAVKKDWEKQVAAARKSGDKLFPKFPTKPFVWERTMKFKKFNNPKSASEWYAKQKGRVDGIMASRAAAIKAEVKAAKGGITAGYKDKDDKKAREKKDKLDLENAAKEKLAEEIELKMAEYLKYNRPVPRHFIVDPVGGAEKNMSKTIAKQEAALKAYQERKKAAESGEVVDTPAEAKPEAKTEE